MANTHVFGTFASSDAAQSTVEELERAGFRRTDISVLAAGSFGNKDIGHEVHSKAPEGIATGATSGAVLGGTLAWLAALGAITIPGIGALLAAGPIVGALAGVGAGAAAGGLTGGLIGMGIPEIEAKRYDGRIRAGAILLSVHVDDSEWEKRARHILEQRGAEDISSVKEAKGDFHSTHKPVAR